MHLTDKVADLKSLASVKGDFKEHIVITSVCRFTVSNELQFKKKNYITYSVFL